MRKNYKYIDAYGDIITFLSRGARTHDEILKCVIESAELTNAEICDSSACGSFSEIRARVGALLEGMLAKGVIIRQPDGRYYSKADAPVALRQEKCEHEILRLLSKGPLTKEKIRTSLVEFFGTHKTKTNRDDNLLGGFINDTLTRLINDGVIVLDGRLYSIPEEKYALADDKQQISGIKADFLSLLHSRGGEFFEYYFMNLLSRYYETLGKKVIRCEVTGGSADGGIDGIAVTRDQLGFVETVMVQTKNRSDYATELDVRGFYGAVNAKGGTRGIYAISSGFHPMAKKLLDEIDDCVGVDGKMIFDMALKTGYGIKTEGERIKIDTSLI